MLTPGLSKEQPRSAAHLAGCPAFVGLVTDSIRSTVAARSTRSSLDGSGTPVAELSLVVADGARSFEALLSISLEHIS